ncbi:MAG TPA: hypothetical protein VIU12_18120 [Chryseolinea sp.]
MKLLKPLFELRGVIHVKRDDLSHMAVDPRKGSNDVKTFDVRMTFR